MKIRSKRCKSYLLGRERKIDRKQRGCSCRARGGKGSVLKACTRCSDCEDEGERKHLKSWARTASESIECEILISSMAKLVLDLLWKDLHFF